jgi:Heavy-metal resistance
MAALALLLSAGAAFAQLPPGKWWRRPDIVNKLQISEEQQGKLDAIFRSSANELIDLKGEVEKANIAVRGDLDQTQLNRQNILRDAARLNEARGRLFSRELGLLVDMRAALTDVQWNRLREEIDRIGNNPPAQQRRNMQPRRPAG